MIKNLMRYGALLIGFEYTNSNTWKKLPGISVDLYQVYRYTKNITKNILVFTDIDKDYNTSILQRAILDGYVDSELLSFLEDIKDRKQYTKYISNQKGGYTTNNFDKTIQNFVKNLDRLVVYYSGHGKNGDVILPDNTHVSLSYLRQLLVDNVTTECQIVSILDCCESNGMQLSYYYDPEYSIFKLYNSDTFMINNIICISSSKNDEDSSATRSGSLFTRMLFGYLYNNYNNNGNNKEHSKEHNKYILISDIKNGSNIYSSYPNNVLLFGWFTRSDHNNIDITIDNNNSIIKIILNNSQPTIDKSSNVNEYLRYHHNGRYN